MRRSINCEIPLFCLTRDNQYYYAAGGGGSCKTGVKNGIMKIPLLGGEEKFISTESQSVSCILSIQDPDDNTKRLILYSVNEFIVISSEDLVPYKRVMCLEVENAEDNMIEIKQMKYIKKTGSLFVSWSHGILQKFNLKNKNLTLELTLEGHKKEISGMCVSSHKKRLFTTSQDRSLKVWDVASGELLKTLYPEDLHKKWDKCIFWGCVVSYDGDDIVIGLMERSKPSYGVVIDSHTFEKKKAFFLSKTQISSCLSTEKTKTLASVGCADGSVVTLSLLKYKVLSVRKHHSFVVTSSTIDISQTVSSVSLDFNFVSTPITNKPYGFIVLAIVVFLAAIIYFYYFH
ncbi:Uncharacterized protein QTN25_001471 [Entamoeba marina]